MGLIPFDRKGNCVTEITVRRYTQDVTRAVEVDVEVANHRPRKEPDGPDCDRAGDAGDRDADPGGRNRLDREVLMTKIAPEIVAFAEAVTPMAPAWGRPANEPVSLIVGSPTIGTPTMALAHVDHLLRKQKEKNQ
jgi:hypothetical protein